MPSNGHAGSLLAIPRPDQRPIRPRGSDGGEGRSGGAAAKGSRAEGQARGALRGGTPAPGRRLGIGRGRFPRNGARPGPPEEPRRRGTGGGGQGKPAPGRRRRKRGAPEPPDGSGRGRPRKRSLRYYHTLPNCALCSLGSDWARPCGARAVLGAELGTGFQRATGTPWARYPSPPRRAIRVGLGLWKQGVMYTVSEAHGRPDRWWEQFG